MTTSVASEDKKAGAFDLRETFIDQAPRLMRLLRRWTSAGEADDILQQSFARLAALDDVQAREIRSPGAYLQRTALNLIYDQAKSSRRRAAEQHIVLDETVLPSPDPIAALEARDMLNRLEEIIARMPPRRREIFLAHRLDGYSYSEIAARTGLSIKGVEKQMSRAIALIDRLMART